MKIHLEKSLLEEAINTVVRAVPSRTTIPALEGIMMEAEDDTLTVTAYNTQTAIRTRVEAEVDDNGRIVINAKLLSEMIRKLPDDTVTLNCGDDLAVKLKCGSANYSVSAFSASDYPELPDVGDAAPFSIKEGVLKSMIGRTVYAVSNNESRPVHTGALFDLSDGTLNVVACDGFRLAMRTESVDAKDMKFVVPRAALNEVERLCVADADSDANISVGERHIMFLVGSTELISRRLDGDFIDYKSAIPQNNPTILTVNAKTMMESLDRVSVVISEKQKSPVRCVIGSNEIVMSAKTATGAAQDKCKVDGDGKDLEIGFNGRYLYEALRYASEPVVRMAFKSAVGPAVITGVSGDGKFTYMVLPVRLKKE